MSRTNSTYPKMTRKGKKVIGFYGLNEIHIIDALSWVWKEWTKKDTNFKLRHEYEHNQNDPNNNKNINFPQISINNNRMDQSGKNTYNKSKKSSVLDSCLYQEE